MKKSYKKMVFIVLGILLILTGLFFMGKGKLISNDNDVIISSSDDKGQYANSIRLTIDYKSDDTYTYKFKIPEGNEKDLSITENSINKDFQLVIENSKEIVYKKDIKKNETLSSFNKKFKQGEYTLTYKFKKDSKGLVEMQIND